MGTWLETELTRDDDAISEPPAAAREFLETHRDAIWGIVSALEKASPRWGDDEAAEGNGLAPSLNRMLPSVFLARTLVGTALVEEREGHALEADRALEASWSLLRPLGERPELIAHLLALAISRFQAGALRKQKAPSLVWMGRLTAEDPYRAMIETILHVHEQRGDSSGLNNRTEEALRKAFDSVFEVLKSMTPCELSATNGEDIERLARERGGVLPSEDQATVDVLSGMATPNLVSAVRRAGRLAVDRELTLQVLRLRLAKEGAKDGKWPAELGNPWSDVCPGIAYRYKTDGASMDVQFGAGVDAGTDRVLPLSFHSGKARTLPTFTPGPTATPTPPPAEEP